MTKRIFRSILLIAVIILFLSLFGITGVLYTNFSNAQRDRLKEEAILALNGVELNGLDYLQRVSVEDLRITLVAADGEVLYDTRGEAASMGNHGTREEIKEALENGVGESSRYSITSFEKMHYYAIRTSDGMVLRVSSGLASVFSLMFRVLSPVTVVFLLAVILSGFLARRMAQRIVTPLNELNLEYPLEMTPMRNFRRFLVR